MPLECDPHFDVITHKLAGGSGSLRFWSNRGPEIRITREGENQHGIAYVD